GLFGLQSGGHGPRRPHPDLGAVQAGADAAHRDRRRAHHEAVAGNGPPPPQTSPQPAPISGPWANPHRVTAITSPKSIFVPPSSQLPFGWPGNRLGGLPAAVRSS